MNHYIPWVIGPFCGQTPETYFAHHMGMHHAEGNLEQDLSTTMPFKRDSFFHFLRYFGRFFFLSIIELTAYHLKKGNRKMARRLVTGELLFIALCVVLAVFVDWRATLVVFITPYLVARWLMMCGNWAQHAFVDQVEPNNDYKSSITCLNTRYNQRCFNDGYHIGHHEKANRHWTEMPDDFESKLDKYRDEGAIIFDGIDYFQIWALLMLKRYGTLAKHFVDLEDTPRSRDEIIELLKSRTFPVARSARAA
jgi:fatty acid desaturase